MKLLSILTLLNIIGGLLIWGKISNIYNNQIRGCSVSIEDDKNYTQTGTGSLQYIFEEGN